MSLSFRARPGRIRAHAIACLAFAFATVAPAFASGPLTLPDALQIAVTGAPQVAVQEAALLAASEARVGASELPDPKLLVGIDNLPVEGGDKFSLTRDFMTMRKIGVMQEFPRGDKLKLRGDRAEAEVRRETALLEVARLNATRDTAIAWIDAWFAEQQVTLLGELEREARLQADASQAALAGGRGAAAEPLAARLYAVQLGDRVIEAKRMAARARAQLARWIGEAAARPLAEPPAFDELSHRHADLLANLEFHPHLGMFAPLQAMADVDVRLAEAAKQPDWSLEASYAQRGRAYSNMVSIGVRIDLPIFEAKRQNPAIASKLAAAGQVRAQAEEARRTLTAEIASQYADWQSARERAVRHESLQVPLARSRSEVALATYRGGQGDLSLVIEARKAEVETRLALLQVRNEQARAWAQLHYQLPDAVARSKP